MHAQHEAEAQGWCSCNSETLLQGRESWPVWAWGDKAQIQLKIALTRPGSLRTKKREWSLQSQLIGCYTIFWTHLLAFLLAGCIYKSPQITHMEYALHRCAQIGVEVKTSLGRQGLGGYGKSLNLQFWEKHPPPPHDVVFYVFRQSCGLRPGSLYWIYPLSFFLLKMSQSLTKSLSCPDWAWTFAIFLLQPHRVLTLQVCTTMPCLICFLNVSFWLLYGCFAIEKMEEE